jgi:serine/threonine-protein kinase ULK/ATG1
MVKRSKLSRKLLDNLESEIQIQKRLNHPHIVALDDCQKSEKFIYLIMEYCSVGDLSILIKKRERLPSIHPCLEAVARDYPSPAGGGLNEVLVRHFAKQLGSALVFLRKDGLAHRDIKPQNLLLNPPPVYTDQNSENINIEGSRMLVGLHSLPVLKLADFGFARVLPSMAMAETLCGSPLYMAPEILRYEKYDATADLWSVGTVLYEMMTGKPPFRAPNHVDLLRKIEANNDRIDFPTSCTSSEELRGLVKALLKRNPLERMSFEEFFEHPVIKNEMPGAKTSIVKSSTEPIYVEPAIRVETGEIRRSSSYRRPAAISDRQSSNAISGDGHLKQELSSSPRSKALPIENSSLPFATPPDRSSGTPPRPADIRRYTTQTGNPQLSTRDRNHPSRPPITGHTTAPVREDLHSHRRVGVAMERAQSKESNLSPSTSLLQQQHENDPEAVRERRGTRTSDNGRELRASADDDYVIVDKQQVQVNAFADELATARRGITPPSNTNALVRRLSSAGSQRTSPRQVSGRGAEYVHPKGSYERKYGSSPGAAAKSALAKALEGVNLRLFGMSVSPPNHSPPNIVPQYPPYPGPGSLVVAGNGVNMVDEDFIALQTIEDSANRSDVVYNFAEVKYAQLMPSAPSVLSAHGLGLVSAGSAQVELGPSVESQSSTELTPDAMILAAEECLVLFVKVLSLLSKATEVAHSWWANAGQPGEPMSTVRMAMSTRVNSIVQWIRERFNNVLDKAEIVQNKIMEAQKDLPPNHPSHRSHHFFSAAGSNFMLTTGVTAEKLMYDRALEMSRASAVNELVGDDLPGCEVAYVTSLRLLEAVLERHEDDESNMDDDDRKLIEKCILTPYLIYSLFFLSSNCSIYSFGSYPSTVECNSEKDGWTF